MLAPLRVRYASWLELDDAGVERDREEDQANVRALPLILRLERGDPPSWHRALELAASGCAQLCLDPRSEPDGEWHDAVAAYCAGHIRKVTRRARGAPWRATADLPGLTFTDDETEVRVLVPGLVREIDPRVAKLQVGGTDVPVDPAPARPAAPGPLVVHVQDDSAMTAGKLMAQAGHAGMIAAALRAHDDPDGLRAWYDAGCPVRVERTSSPEWARLRRTLDDPAAAWQGERLLGVRDAGFTEVDPGTITVIGRVG